MSAPDRSPASAEAELNPGVDFVPPILENKDFGAPSLFQPENLLREARRQKRLPDLDVPRVCVLDPDGDIARHLATSGEGTRHLGWACYHTEMWVTTRRGQELGVVGLAVGAPFAVLVAEQLFASGAELIISVTSAGQIKPVADPPYFVLIDKALRDEGTSLHYQPPAKWSWLPDHLKRLVVLALQGLPESVLTGASWTTDAPYRETEIAINAAIKDDVVCVEMEAAALYAYAAAKSRDIVCLAHITNTMALTEYEFEKGEGNGAHSALEIAEAIATALTRPTLA